MPKLFSLYLLLAIGFRCGHELRKGGLTTEVAITLLVAILMATIVPIYSFLILRFKLNAYSAAAIAASYGSISAVTFITASSFLNRLEVAFDGHMVAALALMESPAMIIGLILVRLFAKDHLHEGKEHKQEKSWGKVLQKAF